MSSAENQITDLIHSSAQADGQGTFFLANGTDDFKFIRPSGNPVDAQQLADMFSSGDVVVTRSEMGQLYKLEIFGDVAFCAYSQSATFTYKGTPNEDNFVISGLLKLVDGRWKFAWLQRSTGDADRSLWS